MDEYKLASMVAEKVVSDAKFWAAIIGFMGAIIGSLLTIIGNIVLHWLKDRPQKTLDASRKDILKTMPLLTGGVGRRGERYEFLR